MKILLYIIIFTLNLFVSAQAKYTCAECQADLANIQHSTVAKMSLSRTCASICNPRQSSQNNSSFTDPQLERRYQNEVRVQGVRKNTLKNNLLNITQNFSKELQIACHNAGMSYHVLGNVYMVNTDCLYNNYMELANGQYLSKTMKKIGARPDESLLVTLIITECAMIQDSVLILQ